MIYRISVFIIALVGVFSQVQAEQVDIPGLGSITGTTSKSSWTERTVYEYLGIKYALAPSGVRRFKAPVKQTPWTGVLDVSKHGKTCPQPASARWNVPHISVAIPDPEIELHLLRSTKNTMDEEDCLTLDVYTPTTNKAAKLPVLVYFHGGAFLIGSSAAYRPGFLLENDIVLVMPQYRLGPLGLLYLDTESAPGNMALMDQIMALQWVQDNIAAFGGDPKKVTIAGTSAGGASVSLHMLSKLTDGMFHQVISQSGSALALWAIESKEGEAHSRKIGEYSGCDASSPPDDLIACLMTKNANTLIYAYLQFSSFERRNGRLGMGGVIPVVQRRAPGVEPVIDISPQITLESGSYNAKPLLTGVTKHEGIFILDIAYQFYLVPNQLLENSTFLANEFVPTLLNMYGVNENSRVMADAVSRRYFDPDILGNFTTMTPSLVDFCGVTLIKGPSFRQAELNSEHAKTFLYSFDHFGNNTLLSPANSTVPVPGGITHGDDTIYLFPMKAYPLKSDEDILVAKRMSKLWGNFVIYGHPTPANQPPVEGVPEWMPFHRDLGQFLSIGEEFKLTSNFRDIMFTVGADQGLTAPPEKDSGTSIMGSPLMVLGVTLVALLRQWAR